MAPVQIGSYGSLPDRSRQLRGFLVSRLVSDVGIKGKTRNLPQLAYNHKLDENLHGGQGAAGEAQNKMRVSIWERAHHNILSASCLDNLRMAHYAGQQPT